MKKVLVFAAHPDDELLGVGGTVCRLAREGICVRAVILAEGLTSRGDKRSDIDPSELEDLQKDACAAAREVGYASIDFCGLPDNRMDEVDLLDIIKIVSSYIEKYEPDTIFTHHHGDLNIDHQRTCEAVLTACRPVGNYKVERIYAFETPSSTEWNFRYEEPFRPNVFFDVTDTLEAKIRGMACYRTESTVSPHPRSPKMLRALGQYRGASVGFEMAEGFELLRELVAAKKQDN
ncbi:MAG: PIG-L family deacetylase [Lachnospiraceae bacterium]|nr:PIG-L family deacetylase [Lachnospiraceae bacterium]